MKKKIITLTLIAALSATATTAVCRPIPRESAPLNATEAQIQITENIVGDIHLWKCRRQAPVTH